MISKNNIIERVSKKYPFLIDEVFISLAKIGNTLELINNMDDSQLIYLGLNDFKKDLKWILGDIRLERKEKLKKINDI